MVAPLTVERIELREIRLRLKEPFEISSGRVSERRILLLELEDAGGASAFSECVAGETPHYGPETVDTAWSAIRDWIAPRVLGREIGDPAEVEAILERDIRGHLMAKAAVEMGIWGLAAESRRIPLARLLGGTQERIPVGISIGIQPSPEALAEKARAAASEGYRRIKVKIRPGADVEFVDAARSALAPGTGLMSDANSAYTLADAEHLSRLDDFDLLMIEQPLAWDDLVRHAALQKMLRTPICLDESITGVDRVEDMLALGSGRIVNVKPGRVGGFAASRAIHDLCVARAIPLWCGGMLESGVGRAYNVALASLPGFTLPSDLSPAARYWERDLVSPAWTMDAQGMGTVPLDRPGIGVEVDRERVDALTVRRETLTPR